MPRFCELIVNFGKEGGRVLAEGLMAPREKPLVQPAARWLLRQRPLEPELVDSFCHNADVLHFIVTRTERDHVTRSQEGRWSCWVKRTGECSLCGDGEARGHWADVSLSPATQILCPTVFSSQVPGRKKMGGCEGRSCSLKRKLSVSAERQDWNSRNESSQSRWAKRQRGISPSMTHTQRECHQHAGETFTSYNDGAAFEISKGNYSSTKQLKS